MATTLGAILLTAASLGFSGHGSKRCDACGVEASAVLREIQQLQTAPRGKIREEAAHDLRDFDWRCHPIVIEALAGALLQDCDDHVRKEAAQSLKKIGGCTPSAHLALRKAADCDPKFCNRFWARRALAAIRRKCDGTCSVCKDGPLVVSPEPIETLPDVVPGEPSLNPTTAYPSEILIEPGPRPIPPAPESPPPIPEPARSPFVEPIPGAGLPLEGPIRETRRIEEKPSTKALADKPSPADEARSRRFRITGLLPGARSRAEDRRR